jgi:hypothetical protein
MRLQARVVGVVLCLGAAALAPTASAEEPGDELIGDWERSIGAARVREVWHITRDRARFTIRGDYLQGDKDVGSFRGEEVNFDAASKTLRFKLVGTAGGKEIDRQMTHELVLKGTRLSLTSSLGKKKDTAVLTKARAVTSTKGTAASGPATFAPTPQTPAFTEVRRIKIGAINYYHSVALSPDGKLLALCDRSREGQGVEIHDVDAGTVIKRLSTGGLLTYMGFTADGGTFVASGFDLNKPSLAIAWDTATWTEKWKFDHGRMTRHAISGDGRFYAAGKGNVPGGPQGALKIWNTSTQQEVYSQEYAHSPRLAFSGDGQTLLFGDGTPAILEWSKKKMVATEAGRGTDDGIADRIFCFAVTADGRGYALGGSPGDSSVLVTASGKLVRSLPRLGDGQGFIKDVKFVDNRRLLVAHSAAEFVLFETTSGRPLAYVKPELAGNRSVANIDVHQGSTRFAAYCGGEAIVFALPSAGAP